MARFLKFRILEVEGLYYPCSENKGADQLRGYCEADLRLCFRICKKQVFSHRGSFYLRLIHENSYILSNCANDKAADQAVQDYRSAFMLA